ncbi:hypothetical protein LF1_22990 [Rubripirellula obstinata]|uniref:Uncharacterized protein n=1 Tax=Rubripirellula obstinata TaxID=406547 RepID=A0A5B1CHS0_9BACT|nr:hypothetical protein [Rubripirellula obstinata]KAA1259762.1 hypothetical protein LF1_22990 [Rubripirellula obstinata]
MSNDHLNSSIFRAALIVLMILGIPVIGVLVYLNIQQVKQEPAAIESETVNAEIVNAEPMPPPTNQLDPPQ